MTGHGLPDECQPTVISTGELKQLRSSERIRTT
jgi:hypothetical protein